MHNIHSPSLGIQEIFAEDLETCLLGVGMHLGYHMN